MYVAPFVAMTHFRTFFRALIVAALGVASACSSSGDAGQTPTDANDEGPCTEGTSRGGMLCPCGPRPSSPTESCQGGKWVPISDPCGYPPDWCHRDAAPDTSDAEASTDGSSDTKDASDAADVGGDTD